MTVLPECGHHVAGMIKFDASVQLETLVAMVTEMKEHSPESWVDLHVRGGGASHVVAFHYILPNGKAKTHKKFFHKLLQQMCNRFGTRPLEDRHSEPMPIGVEWWSISNLRYIA